MSLNDSCGNFETFNFDLLWNKRYTLNQFLFKTCGFQKQFCAAIIFLYLITQIICVFSNENCSVINFLYGWHV